MNAARATVTVTGVVFIITVALSGCYRVAPGTYSFGRPYKDVVAPVATETSSIVIGKMTIRGAQQLSHMLGSQHIPNICQLVNTKEGKNAILLKGYFFKEVDRPGPHAIRCGFWSPYLTAPVRDISTFGIPPGVLVNLGSISVEIGRGDGVKFPVSYKRDHSATPLDAFRSRYPNVYEAYKGKVLEPR